MAWNAVFPTVPTRISQSIQQIQDNWAFIQANINTDHYFNSGAPNEGHHRVVQYINQGADPAVAVDSVLYSKAGSGGRAQPYFRNGTDVRTLATYINGNTVLPAIGVFTLVNLAAMPSFIGFITMYKVGGPGINAAAFVVWDTFNASVTEFAVGGGQILLVAGAGTNITVSVTAGMTLQWQIINMQNNT